MIVVVPSAVQLTPEEKCESLKTILAAVAFDKKLKYTTDMLQAQSAPSVPVLLLDENQTIFKPNSIVRYLGSYSKLSWSQKEALNSWLDVAAYDQESLKRLDSAIGVKLPEMAQIVIFSHIYAFGVDIKGFSNVSKWFAEYSKSKVVLEALKVLTKETSAENTIKVKESVIRKSPAPGSVILPKDGEKNILITSALPYVNNVPHLGNIIGCVLSADVFARYCRLRGYNTVYVCGTDEYGTATETKALEEGVTCQELCDRYHRLHKEIYDWFQIDFDFFGRTTTPAHKEISQGIFMNLYKKGLLLKDSVQQLYCETCKRYLADRYVEGTCPLCGFVDARGDQCDGCGKLLNAIELKDPKCKVCKTAPIVKEATHLFLDLPKLSDKCESFVKERSESGFWTANGKAITGSWFKEGLKPRCITRDLKWGTPVPLPEMSDKVLYVWFDAPIGYLSITANYTKDWEKWWKNPDQVKLYQFMGKDNVPFHTVIFPSTLLGTEDNYTLLHHLSTTEYLNYEGDKFSKSRGIGVFGNNVMDSQIPVDIWRYYLMSNRPETSDSMFTWEDLGVKTNSELLANFGNLISRVLKFTKAKYNSILPEASLKNKAEHDMIKKVNVMLGEYTSAMEAVKLRSALKTVLEITSSANLFLQDNNFDNTLFEKERDRCNGIILIVANIIYLVSALIEPFMPGTAKKILLQLNAPARLIPNEFEIDLLPGHRIGTPEHLFKRLEEKNIQELFMRFGGQKILEARAKKAAEEAARIESEKQKLKQKVSSK
ncbi:hypothetical protein MP638_006759 [Amoeboaphelidium occidentale]|nr:hypothetical protein MP638_006759 [Amoeboaphelidium occidentale]